MQIVLWLSWSWNRSYFLNFLLHYNYLIANSIIRNNFTRFFNPYKMRNSTILTIFPFATSPNPTPTSRLAAQFFGVLNAQCSLTRAPLYHPLLKLDALKSKHVWLFSPKRRGLKNVRTPFHEIHHYFMILSAVEENLNKINCLFFHYDIISSES